MLRLEHIAKSFGATRAVDDVSLTLDGGEIVALAGENGAGKTTLMRIAAGELVADGGTVVREGRVELVHQHFMLVPELSIAENLALTRSGFRFTTRRVLEAEALRIIEASGIELRDVSRRVSELSVGERSKLELIKAIAKQPAVLILDEPTSVLTPHESAELFRVMQRLAESGTALVFISHKLPEVLAVASRIVVMRRGRVVAQRNARETTAEELASVMVEVKDGYQLSVVSSRPMHQEHRRQPTTDNRQPIHAIVGVAGNGQRELAESLLGEAGTAHIPEDRTRDGIVAEMTIAENLALTKPKWRPALAKRDAERLIAQYDIRAQGPQQKAGSLSGGNQQKVVLARELDRKPAKIVAAEPTRGLDIEATRFVHDQLRAAAADGTEILLITSDLDEAFALAGTIQVIYRGRLSERMTPEEARGRVANLMAGVEP